jgi:hypothetical protein
MRTRFGEEVRCRENAVRRTSENILSMGGNVRRIKVGVEDRIHDSIRQVVGISGNLNDPTKPNLTTFDVYHNLQIQQSAIPNTQYEELVLTKSHPKTSRQHRNTLFKGH